MRLYVIKRVNGVNWDEYDSLVIRAETPEKAIVVAQDFAYGFEEENVTVEELHQDGKEGVVHDSFCAG